MLAAKQLGWLYAIPKPPKAKNGKRSKTQSKPKKESPRMKTLPPNSSLKDVSKLVEKASDVFGHFMSLRMYKPSGMGKEPLSWTEIAAYGQYHPLTAWEAGMIAKMSDSFLSGNYLGEDKFSEPPYVPDKERYFAEQREFVAQKRKEMFDRAKKAAS